MLSDEQEEVKPRTNTAKNATELYDKNKLTMDRAEHKSRAGAFDSTGVRRDQAEQISMAEQDDDAAGCRRGQAEQWWSLYRAGRAEQDCSGGDVRDTQSVTLCPTIPGPVARYVKFHRSSS